MLIDLTQIPYDEIKPNSILVIRNSGITSTEDYEQIRPLFQLLREKVGSSVNILFMRPETDVFCVDEKTMNEAGWFKSGGSAPLGAQG